MFLFSPRNDPDQTVPGQGRPDPSWAAFMQPADAIWTSPSSFLQQKMYLASENTLSSFQFPLQFLPAGRAKNEVDK